MSVWQWLAVALLVANGLAFMRSFKLSADIRRMRRELLVRQREAAADPFSWQGSLAHRDETEPFSWLEGKR